jgi:hypothetical protein
LKIDNKKFDASRYLLFGCFCCRYVGKENLLIN